jgi:hypothetical protein
MYGCNCQNLHVLNKSNGVSIILIQWHRGHKKCYVGYEVKSTSTAHGL